MYRRDNGCVNILGIISIIIFSIISAFNGNFIPIIVLLIIITILWVGNVYIKLKNQGEKLNETVESRKKINTNNSKLIIFIIITSIGLIISTIFQSNKREYIRNKRNERNHIIQQMPKPKIIAASTEKKIVKEEFVWLNKIHFGYYFKLPNNFLQISDLTNDNFYLYADEELFLSLSIASDKLEENNLNINIEQYSNKLPEFAQNFNLNNKKNFDDFKLIDYEMSKLGNIKAIKITQTSRKVSGKDIEMKVVSYNLIAKSKYYNVTYSYPKDSIKYDTIFKKIEKSFEFKTK